MSFRSKKEHDFGMTREKFVLKNYEGLEKWGSVDMSQAPRNE